MLTEQKTTQESMALHRSPGDGLATAKQWMLSFSPTQLIKTESLGTRLGKL